jgi:hypothetical protein
VLTVKNKPFTGCIYDECHYAVLLNAIYTNKPFMLSVILLIASMLSVIVLRVINKPFMLNVAMLSAFMLVVAMLRVIMLCVIMLSVATLSVIYMGVVCA